MILDIIITSLINGSTYALLAIGFSLIFGVARIVNKQRGIIMNTNLTELNQLREMEDEITYLNNVELITVDHSAASKIGCTVDGRVFTYKTSVAPISAVDQDGRDWTEAVLITDQVMFTSEGPGHLILTFPNIGTESGICAPWVRRSGQS